MAESRTPLKRKALYDKRCRKRARKRARKVEEKVVRDKAASLRSVGLRSGKRVVLDFGELETALVGGPIGRTLFESLAQISNDDSDDVHVVLASACAQATRQIATCEKLDRNSIALVSGRMDGGKSLDACQAVVLCVFDHEERAESISMVGNIRAKNGDKNRKRVKRPNDRSKFKEFFDHENRYKS